MEVTDEGIVISLSDSHFLKADLEMKVIDDEITICVIGLP